ncbi:MAG: hypothetical protein HC821_02525 [Lewinella sp.]|nr:hypothetical protein [Lewinella sp.]
MASIVQAAEVASAEPATGQERWLLASGELTSDNAIANRSQNMVAVGNGSPDLFGGWNHSLSLGAFQFGAFITFSFGQEALLNPLAATDGRQILINNQEVNQLDRWREPGDLAQVPRLLLDNPLLRRSTRYLYSISYLNLASLNLSYRLKAKQKLPLGLTGLSLSVLLNNLGYYYFGEERKANRNGVAQYRFNFPEQRALVLALKADL